MMAKVSGQKIAFIGLGNMGAPMAGHLAKGGLSLSVYDVNTDTAKRFAADHPSCVIADSPRAAVEGSEVVILMLPNGKVVNDVLLKTDNEGKAAIETLRRGCVVIDMSSSDPSGTKKLGVRLNEYGVDLIDAPVSGGVVKAKSGQLATMVGGDRSVAEKVGPILKMMASNIAFVGPTGAGHAMKALNNYVSAAGLVAACEALVTAQKFGIDGSLAIQILNASTGKNNSTENKLSQYVLSKAFNSGFSLGLMRKDLETARQLSKDLNMKLPLVDDLVKIWESAEKSLGPGADHTEIARIVDKSS